MLSRVIPVLMLAACLSSVAQSPQPEPPKDSEPHATQATIEPVVFKSDFGLSYTYPSDWEVVDSKPIMPAVQLQTKEKADSEMEKRGIDCVQLALTIRHGDPKSVIMALVLPLDCAGIQLKPGDLGGVASGVAQGLKKGMDIDDPKYGAYRLGTHDFWVERSHAVSKAHPDFDVTLEVACSIVKKGLVCWMGMVRDEEALATFETGLAALEDDAPARLVPPTAFKPAVVVSPKSK